MQHRFNKKRVYSAKTICHIIKNRVHCTNHNRSFHKWVYNQYNNHAVKKWLQQISESYKASKTGCNQSKPPHPYYKQRVPQSHASPNHYENVLTHKLSTIDLLSLSWK